MVKVFVGNLPSQATEKEIKALFERFGKVVECDIIRNYGFVHFEDKKAADEAVRKLHHHRLHGVSINVESSRRVNASTKLHVSNISSSCTKDKLRAKFEEYGSVLECDIIKDYGFVHMERAEDAIEAIKGLDNTELKGKQIHVQLSTSRLRSAPGMGDISGCYRCGKEGHWSKECPLDRTRRGVEYTESFIDQYAPVRALEPYTAVQAPTCASAYQDRFCYNLDWYGVIDYYQRYRVRPYTTATYDPYADLRLPTLPQISGTSLRQSIATALDPYERRLLSAHSTSYSTSYLGRDRSPLRHSSTGSTSVGNGYAYERSPVSSVSRSALYDLPRYGRESYTETLRYSAF